MKKPISTKRKEFCLYYCKGEKKKEAARLANYKDSNLANTASFLLKQPDVQEEIKRIMSKAADDLGIDETFVLSRLKEHADDADANISIKALAQIGKHLGMFVDNINHKIIEDQDAYVKDIHKNVVEENLKNEVSYEDY
jgi:phage terminase small subunit